MEILVSVATALIVSIACNLMMASYTFKVIDKHVHGLLEITKKAIKSALNME